MHVVLVLIIDNDYLGCKFWSLYTTVCISLRWIVCQSLSQSGSFSTIL